MKRSPLRVGFLISQHPAINHALLLREVRELRRQNLEILTASIRDPDRPASQLNAEEADEAARTFYVKRTGASGAVKAILATAASRPGALLRGFVYALSLAGTHLRKWPYYLAYLSQAIVLGRWMEREKLKHLHVQYSSTVGLLLKKIFDIELSISFHGPDEFTDPEGFHLRQKIEACRFVRAISSYSKSQLMRSCGYDQWNKIEAVYLGVDGSVFTPRPFRTEPRPFEVICVGRLSPVKAQHVLVDAIHSLHRKGRDVLLHLVGGGPDRQTLEQHIARLGAGAYVVLHGFTLQADLDRLYRQSDVFALASFAEGVPGVLMEAMAMEIPCVATRIMGTPELIEHGTDGLLVPPSDAESMADAIDSLIADAGLRERLGQAARRKIQTRFDLEKNAASLRALFERYCDSAGG